MNNWALGNWLRCVSLDYGMCTVLWLDCSSCSSHWLSIICESGSSLASSIHCFKTAFDRVWHKALTVSMTKGKINVKLLPVIERLIWRDSNKPSLLFPWCCVFFVSKGNPFRLLFYSTVAGVVPCGGRKSLPVHHHSAGYIFYFRFSRRWGGGGIMQPCKLRCYIWKLNRAIFVILCVSKGKSFFLLYFTIKQFSLLLWHRRQAVHN